MAGRGSHDRGRPCYSVAMSRVEDIEKAVSALPRKELERFRAWFEAFDARRFDERIARDAREGRLDGLAGEALADLKAGRAREL